MPRQSEQSTADEPAALFEESVSASDLMREAALPPETEAAELPCTINAVMSASSGGVLGFAFGFGMLPFPSLYAVAYSCRCSASSPYATI